MVTMATIWKTNEKKQTIVIEKYITENKKSLSELKTSPHTILHLNSGASTQPLHAALKTQLQHYQNIWRNLGRQLLIVLILLVQKICFRVRLYSPMMVAGLWHHALWSHTYILPNLFKKELIFSWFKCSVWNSCFVAPLFTCICENTQDL